MLADVRARVAAAVAAREAAVKAVASPEAAPTKVAVTPGRQKVRRDRFRGCPIQRSCSGTVAHDTFMPIICEGFSFDMLLIDSPAVACVRLLHSADSKWFLIGSRGR